jgi:rhodanese-related sulfurtransferase
MRSIITQALVIIALAAVIGVLSNALRADHVPWIAQKRDITTVQVPPPDSAKVVPGSPYPILIKTEQVEMHRGKDAVVIDARLPELYAQGHIPGAVNIPFENLDSYQRALDAVSKDTTVIIYCDGGDCELSYDLAEYMIQHGYQKVFEYEGGWADWTSAKLPVTKGGKP